MPETCWVFAYGSLMWDPGVPVAERVLARLPGWQRSFCLLSICHRGTPETPGLVLGLDQAEGAECRGVALGIAAADWDEAIAAIRERELVTEAYREAEVEVTAEDGRRLPAVTYVMRREHRQYAGGLCLDEQAAMIAAAAGGRGPNVDYLQNFVAHLSALGLADPDFDDLARRVLALRGARAAGA